MLKKVIVKIHGGLGNQLFCYAAARRLALINNAELVLDDRTGFDSDFIYKRTFQLREFNIGARLATPCERFVPFSRVRMLVMRRLSRLIPYRLRPYVEEFDMGFDDRLFRLKMWGTVYLDGYWQSESYFSDIANIIRDEVKVRTPSDPRNLKLRDEILGCNSVALHVRWFHSELECANNSNIAENYYSKAIRLIESKVDDPKFYIFSDDPAAAAKRLGVIGERYRFVNHNEGVGADLDDHWLMKQCKHFVIANSTFSWWAAWLGDYDDKIVIAPDIIRVGVGAWGFDGLIPSSWHKIF